MVPLNQEYSRMLRTPVLLVALPFLCHTSQSSLVWLYSLRGPRKVAVDALRRQIRRHSREIIKLRSAHNTHVPISGLPAELLSEVFLYIVVPGLQDDNTRFTTGTFRFRQVCKHWNEVAVEFPRLWVWLVPGAVRAWPLFNERSKNAPLFLTWPRRPHGSTTSDTLMDPTIPGRIRVLDFSGTNFDLEYLLGALDSSAPSNASSVRLHVTLYDEHGARKHPTGFLSLSFPKLSKLDVKNFLPDFSSPIITTSDLVSLKLSIPYGDKSCYTRSQFSKILQRHPNLQELHLWQGGMPQVEPLESLIPVALPRLVDLQLYGSDAIVVGFVNLIGMSSPLRNVIISFDSTHTTGGSTLPTAVKQILKSYYECRALDHNRKAEHLTISSAPGENTLVFNAGSHPTPPSYRTYNLELRFDKVDDVLVEEICLLFPLDNIDGFTAIGLCLPSDRYHGMFRKMEGLLYLRLDNLDVEPVLDALSFDTPGGGAHMEVTETALDHLHTHRWVFCTAHSQPGIVDPHQPRRPP